MTVSTSGGQNYSSDNPCLRRAFAVLCSAARSRSFNLVVRCLGCVTRPHLAHV